MWLGLRTIGAGAGFLTYYYLFAAIPVIVFYVVVVAVHAGARARWGGGLVGYGLMLALMALYEGAKCPGIAPVAGGVETCEPGRDLRIVLLMSLILAAWGAVVSYRQVRRSS